MITGNNEIRLNPATMNAAVEYFLNNVLFKESVSVATVQYNTTDNVFIIKLMPPQNMAKDKPNNILEDKP